jgi:hypothetical protein
MTTDRVSVFIVSCLWIATVNAQPVPATGNDALRAEVEALRARLQQLENPSPAESAARTSAWLAFSGDLRYRHETINDDAATTERNRHRIRARLRLDADLSDDLSVGFRLATGSSNPVSANATLDGGFSRKDIGFDRAYFAWEANESVTLRGGKMANPMFRAGGQQLIFDNDLNPEGLALGYDGDRVFANIGGFWVEERSDDDDAIVLGLQGGYRGMLGDGVDVVLGISYYDYRNTQGYTPFYLGDAQGNTIDLGGNLLNDYDLAELFAEIGIEAAGHPLRLFADIVENTAADSQSSGFSIGARWRRAEAPGTWDVTWQYADVETDAVLATFSDSNFGGGGTDGKGHVLRTSYSLRENVRVNGAYFLNERGEAASNERDYNRLQLDISFLF